MTGQVGAYSNAQIQRSGNRIEVKSQNPQERNWEIELGEDKIVARTTDNGQGKNYQQHSVTMHGDHADVFQFYHARGASGGGPSQIKFESPVAPSDYQRVGLGITASLIGVPSLAAATSEACSRCGCGG
jgi:hypothetical protein